jgi:phenylpropionate dioxygenase-like ring-hydroxylating dioxygenase large terminal subunit
MKEYRAKVVEQLGKPKEKELRDSIARDRVEANPVTEKNLIVTGKGETLCYDALSGRYFKSDIETIRQVLNKLSRDMMSEQTVSLNQIYSDLDLEETKLGDEMGWHIDDGLIDPSFSSHLANGIPCLVLDFETPPRYQPW